MMKEIDRVLWPETTHGVWMKKDGEQDLVSVIIPTFNRSHYVLEAMDSVWSQTYRPIELIVVDDGSTDETAETIEIWRNQHDLDVSFKLRYFQQKNMGVSGARNHGLIVSEGEFIQYLDSDDLLMPERLSQCVNTFKKHKSVELVHSAFYLDYSGNSKRGLVIYGPVSLGKDPGPMHFIWTAAGLCRREITFNAGPWNEELRICEDAEYFSRVLAVAEDVLALSNALVVKRKHEEHRLVDLRGKESGLRNKYLSMLLRERTLQSCGYSEIHLTGGWLQLAQDALSAGLTDLSKQILAHSKGGCKHMSRSQLRWHILKFCSLIPRQVAMVSCRLATHIRNTLKWRLDSMRGKIRRVRNG